MLRAVLDVNVLVAALLSASGSPAQILRYWRDGHFELIISPLLVMELERVLGYPKIARHISSSDAQAFVASLLRNSTSAPDPVDRPLHTADAQDDYLLNLAASQRALIVSGDAHLLALAGNHPIYTPGEFKVTLEAAG